VSVDTSQSRRMNRWIEYEWISQLISNAIVTTSQSTCGKLEFTSAMSNAYFASLLDSSISPLFAQSLLLHLLVI
jgi:hypothetical protein